jgi:hypothetical protein
MPKAVFHTPPEHEEEEHVSQEVQPSPVQEHGNEDGDEEPCGWQVCEPIARDISRRDDSKDKYQAVNIWAVRKFKEEDPYIRDDDDQSNKPEAPPPDVVGGGGGSIDPLFYMGKLLATTGKAAVGKSIFPAKCS